MPRHGAAACWKANDGWTSGELTPGTRRPACRCAGPLAGIIPPEQRMSTPFRLCL